MLTRCPQCFAWFRVRAEHLSVAKGLVTCGRCDHVFNALESLLEEAPPPPATPPPMAAAPAVAAPLEPAPRSPLRFVTVNAAPTLLPAREPAPLAGPSIGVASAAPLAADPPGAAPVAPPAPPPLRFQSVEASVSLEPPRPPPLPPAPATALIRPTSVALGRALPLPAPGGAADQAPPAAAPHAGADEVPALDARASPDRGPDPERGDPAPAIALEEAFDLADRARVMLSDDFDQPAPPVDDEDLDIGPMRRRDDALDISDFDFAAIDDRDHIAAPPSPAITGQVHERDARDETDPHALAALRVATPPTSVLPLVPSDPDYVPPQRGDDDDARDDTDPQARAAAAAGHAPRPGLAAAGATDVPAVLAADLAALAAPPRPAAWRAFAWAAFAFLLAAAALLQAAFMERQAVVAALPQAAQVIDALCARLPCLERRARTATVRLLARDVREHPSYRDALLVNATIINDGQTPTPYPVIDLRLRDAAGNVLAARRFTPKDYLDQSIALDDGMPPERPVYIVLELAGNASNAVSFEFTFL